MRARSPPPLLPSIHRSRLIRRDPPPPARYRPTMDAMEELSQLSESIRQAASLLADDSAPRRPSNFLNVVVLGNVLSTGFYSSSCPGVLGAVASVVQSAVANEPRMGASILRLFFHDCFVQGCDGSLLLDYTASFQGEKMATPNNGSSAYEAQRFDDLQNIKLRNKTLQSSAENVNGICLPFVLVKITLVLNLQSDIPMFTTADLIY
ncbi:Peroxidase 4 [Hordeum vulgare]|nr:Peroxidase 4 [Hordeum vulgare]